MFQSGKAIVNKNILQQFLSSFELVLALTHLIFKACKILTAVYDNIQKAMAHRVHRDHYDRFIF